MNLINYESRTGSPDLWFRRRSIGLFFCLLVSFVAVGIFAHESVQATAVVEPSPSPSHLPASSTQRLPFCPGVRQQTGKIDGFVEASAVMGSPLMLIENVGQFEDEVRYQMWGGSWLLGLSEAALTITWFRGSPQAAPANHTGGVVGQGAQIQAHTVRLRFLDANPQLRMEAFQPLATKVSYFIGNEPDKWYAAVPVWGGVRYIELYPGIDLEISGVNSRWQPRLIVHSPAALADVRLQVEGADKVVVDDDNLQLETAVGLWQLPLFALVSADGKPLPRPKSPQLWQNRIKFPFAPPGSAHTTGISAQRAATLNFATYLGALTFDGGRIAVGPDKAIYIGGMTYPYPAGDDGICGVGQLSDAPCHQAFVAKLNTAGTGLDYFFWFGGNAADGVEDIAVDASGTVYATGWTNSTNFFITPGAVSATHGSGQWDGFVTKVHPSGTSAAYSTYLPATAEEWGYDIAVDATGSALVTGKFIAGNHSNAMVLKLNSAGNSQLYGASLGGSLDDAGISLAVDNMGAAYVTGFTYSANYPVTSGALQATFAGTYDGFVTKLNSSGNLVYSTFLPANSSEAGRGIEVDNNGFAYITGAINNGSFVMKLSQNGQSQIYGKTLSANDTIQANGIAVDAMGAAYLTGVTLASNLPTTADALQPTKPLYNADPRDSFIAKYDGQGELAYATYLGGNELDYGTRIAVDQDGAAYATGFTNSASIGEGGGFPTTNGSFRPLYEPGCQDPFVVKLTVDSDQATLFVPLILK